MSVYPTTRVLGSKTWGTWIYKLVDFNLMRVYGNHSLKREGVGAGGVYWKLVREMGNDPCLHKHETMFCCKFCGGKVNKNGGFLNPSFISPASQHVVELLVIVLSMSEIIAFIKISPANIVLSSFSSYSVWERSHLMSSSLRLNSSSSIDTYWSVLIKMKSLSSPPSFGYNDLSILL